MTAKNRRKTGLAVWTELKSGIRELRPAVFLLLAAAGCVNAIGVTIFLFPVRLYDSGISGLSMLLDQVTPDVWTLPCFLLLLNVPIFLFGLKRQGVSFTIYSIFTVAVYSLAAFVIMSVLPVEFSAGSPLAGYDLLLCAVFGGLISGLGSGLTIRFGGAIDGVDVLSVIFAKTLGISIGSFVMTFNTILYVICGIVLRSWILPLYSILTYFIGARTVDFVVEGFDRAKCAMIVTTKAAAIAAALSEAFDASGTIVNAVGGYSKEEKEILYYVINRFQIGKMKRIVHEIDHAAFITFQDVSDMVKRPD